MIRHVPRRGVGSRSSGISLPGQARVPPRTPSTFLVPHRRSAVCPPRGRVEPSGGPDVAPGSRGRVLVSLGRMLGLPGVAFPGRFTPLLWGSVGSSPPLTIAAPSLPSGRVRTCMPPLPPSTGSRRLSAPPRRQCGPSPRAPGGGAPACPPATPRPPIRLTARPRACRRRRAHGAPRHPSLPGMPGFAGLFQVAPRLRAGARVSTTFPISTRQTRQKYLTY